MMSVLFIDDDVDIREGVEMLLEDAGWAVTTAENGKVALGFLQQGLRPSVIVMDLMMPVMSGWELREHLLRDAAMASIPMVVVTGDTRAGRRAEELGASGWLSKPFDVTALLEMLARLASP